MALTSILSFNPTFIGQQSHSSFTILNDSLEKITFSFYQNATEYEDGIMYEQLLLEGNVRLSFTDASHFRHPNFLLYPLEGVIYPKSSIQILVTFTPDWNGHIEASAYCHLSNSTSRQALLLSGIGLGPTAPPEDSPITIIPPSLACNSNTLDFGLSSVGFSYSKEFTVTNTSPYPIDVSFTVDVDGSFLRREFSIFPEEISLNAKESQDISVTFVPIHIENVEKTLIATIKGLNEPLFELPIKADVILPSLKTSNPIIDLGSAYLGNEYFSEFNLINSFPVLARFEIIPPASAISNIISLNFSDFTGVLAPNSNFQVKFSYVVHKRGPFSTAIRVFSVGDLSDESSSQVLDLKLIVDGVGPRLIFDPPTVDFSTIKVLEEHTKTCQITNVGEVVANISVYIEEKSLSKLKSTVRNANSLVFPAIFAVETQQFTISPGDSFSLPITAVLPDSTTFADVMVVVIEDGDDVMIPIKAKGKGVALKFPDLIVNHDDTSTLDLGNLLTHQAISHVIKVENQSYQTQSVSWSVKKESSCFSISPLRAFLEPLHYQIFIIEGTANADVAVSEILTCNSATTGHPSRTALTLNVKSNFVSPLLSFNQKTVDFEYIWVVENDDVIPRVKNSVKFSNVSPLPLSFNVVLPQIPGLECSHDSEITLQSKEEITVDFLMDFEVLCQSQVSQSISTFIKILYSDHPRRENLGLNISTNFPAVEFQSKMIDFGGGIANLTRQEIISISNPSKCRVFADLSFLIDSNDHVIPAINVNDFLSLGKKKSELLAHFPVTSIFMLQPVRFELSPLESINLSCFFSPPITAGFYTNLQCNVVGGQSKMIEVKGFAGDFNYEVDNSEISFGNLLVNESSTRIISVKNLGTLDLKFSVSDCFPGLSVVPSSGTVKHGSTLQLKITLKNSTVGEISETFRVDFVDFNPLSVAVSANILPIISKIPCDFGAITPGTISKKTISITNPFNSPLTFSLSSKAPSVHGITIIPEKVSKLPPLTSQSIDVVFNSQVYRQSISRAQSRQSTSRKVADDLDFNLSVTCSNGSVFHFIFSAVITNPSISVQSNLIDFGVVSLGDSSEFLDFSVQNTSLVPAFVSFALDLNSFLLLNHEDPDYCDQFTTSFEEKISNGCFIPGGSGGLTHTIPPKSVLNFPLNFSPITHGLYSSKLLVKLNNKVNSIVELKGKAIGPRITVNKEVIDFGTFLSNQSNSTLQEIIELKNNHPDDVAGVSIKFCDCLSNCGFQFSRKNPNYIPNKKISTKKGGKTPDLDPNVSMEFLPVDWFELLPQSTVEIFVTTNSNILDNNFHSFCIIPDHMSASPIKVELRASVRDPTPPPSEPVDTPIDPPSEPVIKEKKDKKKKESIKREVTPPPDSVEPPLDPPKPPPEIIVAITVNQRKAQNSELSRDNQKLIDFGDVRINEKRVEVVTISNKGEQTITGRINMTRNFKTFSVSPMNFELPAGADVSVFCTYHAQSLKPFNLDAFSLFISDLINGIHVKPFVFKVKAVAHNHEFQSNLTSSFIDFSKVLPKSVGEKQFTITNSGVFPFLISFSRDPINCDCFDLISSSPIMSSADVPPRPKSKTQQKLPKVVEKKEEKDENLAQIYRDTGVFDYSKYVSNEVFEVDENFKISCTSSLILPGNTEKFVVNFSSPIAGKFSSKFYYKISNLPGSVVNLTADVITTSLSRDPLNIASTLPILYRPLSKTLSPTFFLAPENSIKFCPIILNSSQSNLIDLVKNFNVAINSTNCILNLVNNSFIPCNVDVAVQSKVQAKGAKPIQSVFSVDKNSLTVDPGSNQKLTVNCSVSAVGQFDAEILIKISDPQSIYEFCPEVLKPLVIPVFAESFAPNFGLNFENFALDFGGKKSPEVKFPKTYVSKRTSQQFTVSNSNSVPLVFSAKIVGVGPFSLDGIYENFVIPPNNSQEIFIIFGPISSGQFNSDLEVVLVGGSQKQSIKLIGEGVDSDIVIQNLDEYFLDLGHAIIGQLVSKNFTLYNKSQNLAKFEIETSFSENFVQILPTVGHILPNQTKNFSVKFLPEAPVSISNSPFSIKCSSIIPLEEQIFTSNFGAGWDNTITEAKLMTRNAYVALTEPKESKKPQISRQPSAKGSKRVQKSLDQSRDTAQNDPESDRLFCFDVPLPEPPSNPLGKPVVLEALFSAHSDHRTYECNVSKSIKFRETMLYSTRVYKFEVKNSSRTILPYSFKFLNFNGFEDSQYYTITPQQGEILPQKLQTFELKFSPTALESDYHRQLIAEIPGLSKNCPPLSLSLNAKVVRPICYFNMSTVDQNSSGYEQLIQANPGIHCILISAISVAPTTVDFFVENPTDVDYDFNWSCDGDLSLISCKVKKGRIAAGKKTRMIFEFSPESRLSVCENIWHFEIPSRQINEPFLIRGECIVEI
ncbi:hypothetical protein RCL1_005134 [Eukaryota sp. TZLM3-RCL]